MRPINPGPGQLKLLDSLLKKAEATSYGENYDFASIDSYEAFSRRVPVTDYNHIEPGIVELKKGAKDVFWPGGVNSFAVSSGTTGEGKHLPLTRDRLKSDLRFMRKVIFSYLRQRPNIFGLMGNHLSLPGSLHEENGLSIGEISAFTALQAPFWLRWMQVEDPAALTRLNFSNKFERVLDRSARKNVRTVTAAPSWILTLFQELLKKTGGDSISSLWPGLRLLVCGGAKLSNYRPSLQKLIGDRKVDYIETYGASEGYFAFTDDLDRGDLHLVTGNGIFYEFIADPLPGRESLAIQETVPLSGVETGIPYAMVVTTNSGLWRYGMNDIVEFTETDPPRIRVLGRLAEMLDDFGEALYIHEAREALKAATAAMDLKTGVFTIGSLLEDEHSVPRHLWFIQSGNPLHPDTLRRLEDKIDGHLREMNRHYAIRRESGALGKPEVHTISQHRINAWLEQSGKNTAQGKLPAVLRDRGDIEFFRT